MENFVDADSDPNVIQPPLPPVPMDNCSAALGGLADCETLGKPDTLTFRYTGGGCALIGENAATLANQKPPTCSESSHR